MKADQLAVAKRRATGLLVLMAGVFVLVSVLGDGEGWDRYVRALAEGSLVGGLADWFAVTALFRRPLGLPIPHTAIIPERKESFGRTLGEFVQEQFLTPAAIVERVRASGMVPRMVDWLADPIHSEVVSGHLAEGAVGVANALADDDVHRAIEDMLGRQIERLRLAPLAGKALAAVTADGRHQELLGALLEGFDRFLEENHERLRARFSRESPWWIPSVVDRRIFQSVFDGVRKVLHDVASDPAHELRHQLDDRIRGLIDDLQSSPELEARGERLKRELLAQAQLRRWSASLWADLKGRLRAQAADPGSELRARLAAAMAGAARRVRDDPVLRARAEDLAEAAARYVAEHFHDEIAELIVNAVARWDATETSRRLELLLGADLQFIRINGTVVGGLAGIAIYAAGSLIG